MTVGEILARDADPVIEFRGDDVGAFCDLFQSLGQEGDWSWIRDSSYVLGVRRPPPFLDEIPRIWIGQALNRDWYIEAATI